MKYIIILSFILSANSFAVIPIKKDQKSPETGYIFNIDEEKQVRGINEKKIKLEDLAVKQEELNNSQNTRIIELEKEVKKNSFTTIQKIIYFGLGILTTSIIIGITNKVSK